MAKRCLARPKCTATCAPLSAKSERMDDLELCRVTTWSARQASSNRNPLLHGGAWFLLLCGTLPRLPIRARALTHSFTATMAHRVTISAIRSYAKRSFGLSLAIVEMAASLRGFGCADISTSRCPGPNQVVDQPASYAAAFSCAQFGKLKLDIG